MADGQIGSTKSTPAGDICTLADGQIGSTRSSATNPGSATTGGLWESFSFAVKAFLNAF